MGNIKDIPCMERPYEKLLMYGEKALSNSELLSIVIRNGTKKKSALEVAQNLIKLSEDDFSNLRFLQTISTSELEKVDGIGKAKAIELKAIGEIARRIVKPVEKNQIKSKSDVAKLFMNELQNEKNEILKIVLLNNQNIIKKVLTIAVGSENNICTNIKAILAPIGLIF